MASRLATLLHPARFQSAHKADRWFEGWYFKLVDDRCSRALAVIPGVSRDEQGGTSHAFVQLIEPGGHVRYIRYPFDAFAWAEDRFEIAVGANRFSASGIELDLPAEGAHPPVRGAVAFDGWSPWPVTLASPGIMGWYRYVPRMECYHGVLSLDHALSGVDHPRRGHDRLRRWPRLRREGLGHLVPELVGVGAEQPLRRRRRRRAPRRVAHALGGAHPLARLELHRPHRRTAARRRPAAAVRDLHRLAPRRGRDLPRRSRDRRARPRPRAARGRHRDAHRRAQGPRARRDARSRRRGSRRARARGAARPQRADGCCSREPDRALAPRS